MTRGRRRGASGADGTAAPPDRARSSRAIARRDFIVAAGLGTFAHVRAVPAAERGMEPDRPDPRLSNHGIVKLIASLDGRATPWWFAGLLYAVQPGRAPLPLVRCEGCEVYFPKRLPRGDFLLGGNTLTFFRDAVTRAFLSEFANPLTGRAIPVRANVLESGTEAGMLYPANGGSGYMVGRLGSTGQLAYEPPERDAGQPRGELSWEQSGECVFATTSRSIATPNQPWLEMSTSFAAARDFFDPGVESVSAHGTASYLSPWLRWLDMQAVPGHLFWHVGAAKLRSLDDLPADYRRHAEGNGLLRVLGGTPT